MRSIVILVAVLALAVPSAAAAATKTVGADLSRPANSTRTCETGFFPPSVMGTGFPYTPYDTCTWWSAGALDGSANAVVPWGGGTVRRVRVKVGPVTGRMQVVALRMIRHPMSGAEPGCCFPSSASPVFTPEADAITEIAVDMPVKHEQDRASGVMNFDVLALSVLDAHVPVPAQMGGDPMGGGIMGMFPAYEPGTERAAGYGAIDPGHVLLSADVETPDGTTATTGALPAAGATPAAGTTTRPVTPARRAAAPLTVGADRAVVRRGVARLPVTCTGRTRCRAVVVLQAATGARPAVFGRKRVTIAAGRTTTVRVRLARKGRAALARRSSVRAVAVVRVGGDEVARRAVTLTR